VTAKAPSAVPTPTFGAEAEVLLDVAEDAADGELAAPALGVANTPPGEASDDLD
ncbi:hypothetical protein LTR53_019946, partial [Teratosphaeriaceae sp. CCFEE 6253]